MSAPVDIPVAKETPSSSEVIAINTIPATPTSDAPVALGPTPATTVTASTDAPAAPNVIVAADPSAAANNTAFDDIVCDDGSEKLLKPKDKRLERLKKKRLQFSSGRSTVSGSTSLASSG